MMSNDRSGEGDGGGRRGLRRDIPSGAVGGSLGAWRNRLERDWWRALAVVIIVFSAIPIANHLRGESTKDYKLWYNVGVAVRQGMDIYPRPETGRLFPFMYPPAAAAMLAPLSMLGETGMLAVLVSLISASWVASIGLSLYLINPVCAGVRRSSCVLIVPTLSVIVLIYNIYLLGQPNLTLLALILGAFACLRLGREVSAGALVATAAAIKAFPIMVLGYLIYRRKWWASGATVVVLAAWLLAAPLVFRTPAQVIEDLQIWSQGMVFTYNTHGIAQRPFRSYSYKNQSIMALAHRLLRDMPADGEAVLSEKARAELALVKGPTAAETGIDPFAHLKPHAPKNTPIAPASGPSAIAAASHGPGVAAEPGGRWDDALVGSEPVFKNAWKVNVAALDFRAVTVATGIAVLAICLFVLFVLPANIRRTPETDAFEFGIVTLLTTMFSPLSFNYAYVWLLFPVALGLHLALSMPQGTSARRRWLVWIAAVVIIPALAIPFPKGAQAYGNLFVPALLLLIGFGLRLRGLDRGTANVPVAQPPGPLGTSREWVRDTVVSS
jgi:hypothetical protein